MTIAKIYKCFIASPSDTQDERDICDDVFAKLNETIGQHLGFRIESKRWEKNARPSFGKDGQAVINEQLLNDYQLFIGIMGNKFGTPTSRAGSGTEEEFDQAYEKHNEGADVEIMLYFNDAPVSMSKVDIEQLGKVKAYQKKVANLGALYKSYNGPSDFKEKLERNLHDYFANLSHSPSNSDHKKSTNKMENEALDKAVAMVLQTRLSEALSLFSNQPKVWVDPIISKTNDISENADENYDNRIDISEFVDKPSSAFVMSPPQFGLTCLAIHLCQTAWIKSKTWIYIDARKTSRSDVEKSVNKELENLNLGGKPIDCIVLDSWNSEESGARKLLRNLSNAYKDVPIVVMQTIEDAQFSSAQDEVKIAREFVQLHLLALPRNQIRKFIAEYNDIKCVGEENSVVTKVVSDLAVLNVHRTPQNCLTLLKVAEKHFDESPVNRTKMIEMVLFVLFDLNELPRYTSLPDVKDCEYVLGCFCEKLLRNNLYEFERNILLEDLEVYCEDKLLHLEVSVVFEVLQQNNILIQKSNGFYAFRSTYWIYYFAATRMYINAEFCKYIIEERPYPEIIEFYTGIDRNRSDLLEILTMDLANACSLVESKTGLDDATSLNPLRTASWCPSEESVDEMLSEIQEDVITSKLPDSVKDRYADTHYDQRKPYDQSVQNILKDYSMLALKNQILASSRALRNSDYVDSKIKSKLLKQVTRGWRIWSKILFVLSPLLAEEGRAAFDGQAFRLSGDFGDTKEKRLNHIFLSNPYNVVMQFQDDLYSQKIGPLLYSGIEAEQDELSVHLLVSLVVATRPPNWRKSVEKHIDSLPTNSFYLWDIVNSMRRSLQFDFIGGQEKNEISFLLKKSLAKHKFDEKIPTMNHIKQMKPTSLKSSDRPQ